MSETPAVDLSLLPERDDLILATYRGSVAHGMYVPPEDPTSIDDIDIVGVVVPNLEYYYGLRQFGIRGTKEHFIGNLDAVVYEVRKAVHLLAKGNPNMLSMLWVRPEHILFNSPAGEALIAARQLFVAKNVYKALAGYAAGQLHKMTHGAFQGYMGDKRKRLVEQFGYDTKNAAHLIRLLQMGIEFFETGVLNVYRTDDVEELLNIKRGGWRLEDVRDAAETLFSALRRVRDAADMPDEPDIDAVNELCTDVVQLAAAKSETPAPGGGSVGVSGGKGGNS